MSRTGSALALGIALAAVSASPGPASAAGRPDVVLVVMDTARRDHFSTYGYVKDTTPRFGAFAREAILFSDAYSTSSWTVPAHASLFTGLYAASHGANQETQYLSDDAVTLAEILSRAGYQTASFSGNPWISGLANLAQGFDKSEVVWYSRTQPTGNGLPHGQNTKIFRWLNARDRDRPFFLFVNFVEAHWRYQAPADLQRRFVPGGRAVDQDDKAMFPAQRAYLHPERIRPEYLPIRAGMYDADLAYTDSILGELLRGLRERGLLDDALVIVTADHGENHGDNGYFAHMFSLGQGLIRIPLAIRLPGGEQAGTVRTDRAQLVDLFATILSAAGEPVPALPLPVFDLLAGPVPPEREILTEYYYPAQVLDSFPKGATENEHLQPYLRRIRALVSGSDKLVWGSDRKIELYDLATDPGESHDISTEHPRRARKLAARLDALVARCSDAALATQSKGEMTPETEEQLRALGYVR